MRSFFNLAAAMMALTSMVISAHSTPMLITQLDPSVRIENLTILPNSTIIYCNSYTGELFGINPLQGSSAKPYYVTTFGPRSMSIFGLASPSSNTVAATAGQFNWNNATAVYGTSVVYQVTLTKKGPKTHAFPIPSAKWLNGLAPVPGAPHYLLIADCVAGALLRLDTRTGHVVTVSTDPLFATVPSEGFELGINGVHALRGYAYFTNTNQDIYGRIAITSEGLSAGKPAEKIADGLSGATYDDFALRSDATAFLASGGGTDGKFGIEELTEKGTGHMIADWDFGSTVISQPTSAVFGRTNKDRGTLYFATAGQYQGSGVDPTGAQLFSLKVGTDCKA